MEEARVIDDDGGAPGVVGIAAMIGLGKAAFEILFGILGIAVANTIGDDFGTGALIFGLAFLISSWLLLKGNRIGFLATVALSALGLVAAVVYLFRSSDAVFAAVFLVAGLNALVLYLLLGTRSAREYFTH
jgi:uncharacterized membrane protein (UPF0136 family)